MDSPESEVSVKIPPLRAEERAAVQSDDDGKALDQLEAGMFAAGDSAEQLAAQAAADEASRAKHFRDNFEIVAIATLHLSFFTLSVMALTWALHLILPTPYRWLSPTDLNHVQTLLTAGVLVGVVGNHFKKRMGS